MLLYASSSDFDQEKEAGIFKATFDCIANHLGDNAFKRYNKSKGRFEGKFLVAAFECITVGVGKNIESNTLEQDAQEFAKKTQEIWSSKNFQDHSGSGTNVSSRLPVLIPLGIALFKDARD